MYIGGTSQNVATTATSSIIKSQPNQQASTCILEDYFYVIKDHARRCVNEVPKTIRFTGRKISEFKSEIFLKNFAHLRKTAASAVHMSQDGGMSMLVNGLGIGCLTEKDLEVLHNGQILDNDNEIEYCFTQASNPLIVYVPTDLTPEEFRDYTKIAISNLESFKHCGGQQMAEMNGLQIEIDQILDNHTQGYQNEVLGIKISDSQMIGDSQISTKNLLPIKRSYSQSSYQYSAAPPSSQKTEVIDLDEFDGEEYLKSQASQISQISHLSNRTKMSSHDEYYERLTQRNRSLKKINVRPLIDRIEELVRMFGGPHLAFDMEWKIRLFIIEVLNYAVIMSSAQPNFYMLQNESTNNLSSQQPMTIDLSCDQDEATPSLSQLYSQTNNNILERSTNPTSKLKPSSFQHNTLRLDGEKGIEQFGQRVQPDLTVQTNDTLGTMLYVIEIKNFKTIKGKGILKTAISENFKQLRNFCLLKKKPDVTGISTNFGMWIFTRYIKKDEMLGQKSSPFMVSEPIEIMDINDSRVREDELQRLILVLDQLCQINKRHAEDTNAL